MDLTEIILDFIASFAWPAVVLTFGILFRRELSNIAARVTSVETPWATLRLDQQIREIKEQVIAVNQAHREDPTVQTAPSNASPMPLLDHVDYQMQKQFVSLQFGANRLGLGPQETAAEAIRTLCTGLAEIFFDSPDKEHPEALLALLPDDLADAGRQILRVGHDIAVAKNPPSPEGISDFVASCSQLAFAVVSWARENRPPHDVSALWPTE